MRAHDRRLLQKFVDDVDSVQQRGSVEEDYDLSSPQSRSPTKGRGLSRATTRSEATAALKEVIPEIGPPIMSRVASRLPTMSEAALAAVNSDDEYMSSPTAQKASPSRRSVPKPRGKRKPSPPIGLERKLEDLYTRAQVRQRKLEEAQALVAQRLFRMKELRDERFKRLLECIMGKGEDNFAHVMAMMTREFDEIEHQRHERLFGDWEEMVYNRIAEQAFNHLNPPDRRKEQADTGRKSVQWKLPNEQFKIQHNPKDDPVKKGWVTGDQESAFHKAAVRLLGQSHSAPTLGSCLDKPVTKPVLEPTDWHPQRVQGSMYGGHLTQAHEAMALGAEARRQKRGGAGVHLADHQADEAEAAGPRICRVNGHLDKGILKGDMASRGETSLFKNHHGSSSGAPAQDHFHLPKGTEVTTLEFPPGKRSGYAVQRLS